MNILLMKKCYTEWSALYITRMCTVLHEPITVQRAGRAWKRFIFKENAMAALVR